ncbi:NAD-dependent epimerase/dehydratase family protein [Clostridiales bacterium COT073_COT-073]|nr:NAD-dependent epimerase/dehydratase family protein [Clostridiales bacterium COT073_COT-073]
MKPILYIITGANGHLASTIIRYLSQENCVIRGLILPGEENQDSDNVHYFKGDVTKPSSLLEIFSGIREYEVIVIHAAGMISIEDKITPALYNTNVNGTKNIIRFCQAYKVKRLVYISSVHAIEEGDHISVIREVNTFSTEKVTGAYAKTKAKASQAVMDAVRDGLDAVVVHPSGILGPLDNGKNHITQFIQLYLSGKLPAGVTGGYDFVDVRDVAQGCIAAAKDGEKGEAYILSNRYVTIKGLLEYMRLATNGKKKICLPLKLAKWFVPVFAWSAKQKNQRALYTKYALYTMDSNSHFSHDKATRKLGYSPRDIKDSIKDTILYLKTGSYVL